MLLKSKKLCKRRIGIDSYRTFLLETLIALLACIVALWLTVTITITRLALKAFALALTLVLALILSLILTGTIMIATVLVKPLAATIVTRVLRFAAF